jgi:RNA polymerase sigma-70 factor (ECF subfamily)
MGMTGASSVPGRCDAEAGELVRSLYRDHGAMLLAYCTRRLGGDRQAAEDVLQETLVRAWRHAATLRADGRSERGWLITVAGRVIVDGRRRSAVRPREVAASAAATVPAVDEIDRAVARLTVTAALARLSRPHREVVVEMYVRGCTAVEAAAVLGVPVGTVRSRVFYGLKALRSALQESSQGGNSRDDSSAA